MTDESAVPRGQPSAGGLVARYLRHLFASAPADPRPARAARRLLKARSRFDREPARLAVLWPPFLNAVLDPRIAVFLTADDLIALERTARLVSEKSGGRLGPDRTWEPVREAHDTLAERADGPAILKELWQSPPSDLTGIWRVTKELARRRGGGADPPATYAPALADVDFLETEPEIARALTECLAIDSRAGNERARRAVELARYLRSRRIYVPGSDRALGFGCLLLDEDYRGAERHLGTAYASGQHDSEVLTALLSVLVRNGEAARAAALARTAGHGGTERIAELAELSAALSWLDDLTANGPPPVASARLRELTAAEMTGEWLRYAIGRLCLVEGDARAAAEILAPLARAHPDRPDWGYHAAAALALCGDHPGVSGLWEAARSESAGWPVGCQLMDLDVGCAASVLGQATIPPAYAETVATRIVLSFWAKPPTPAPVGWRPGGGTACEDTEAFRASLGRWLLDHDQQALTDALSLPVFAHLPAAERTLWAAIAALPRHTDDGRAMLLHADRLGHPRAALVLAFLRLTEESHAAGDVPDVTQHGIRSPMPELLHAWSDARAGRQQEAERRLTRLVGVGDARARYALAGGDLRKATRAAVSGQPDDARRHARHAKDRLRDLLASSPPRFDDEARILLRFAELIAGEPAPAETSVAALGEQIPGWPTPSGSAWFRWLAAMARLSAGDGVPDLATARFLADALDLAGDPPAPIVSSAAALITRACLASTEPDDADTLIELLSRLTRWLPQDATARRLYGKATAALMRARDDGLAGDGSALTGTTFAEPSLVLAERALRAGDTAAAIQALRAARPHEDPEARLCHVLADLLEGHRPSADLPDLDGPGAQWAAALKVAFARDRDPLTWGKSLLALTRDRDAAMIVDVRANLPALCAAIGASRDPDVPGKVAEAVRDLARRGDGTQTVVAARCATAIRDCEAAHRLWVRALNGSGGIVPATLRDETSRALRHVAVLARRQGDDLRAIWSLRVAQEHELADTLELQLATGRLIDILFPWIVGQRADRPGRYRVLEEVIEGSSVLKTALLRSDPARVRAAWASCLRERRDDLRFLHAVAVLYRENGLSALEQPGVGGVLVVATTLWSLLLGTDAFWHRFPGLDAQDGLADKVMDSLLAGHAAIGTRALGAGDKDTAAEHLRMLTACGAGHDSLTRHLGDRLGIGWRWPPGAGAGHIRELADRYLAQWGARIAHDAREAIEDTHGLDLPSGINKNYAGAVTVLESFADLGMRARREVAITALEFCNEWCHAYAQEPDGKGQRTVLRVLKTAEKFADQLIWVTPKGKSERAENQAISNYYQLRAWAATTRHDKYRYFTEALDWNPSNGFAVQMRKKYYDDGDKPAGKES